MTTTTLGIAVPQAATLHANLRDLLSRGASALHAQITNDDPPGNQYVEIVGDWEGTNDNGTLTSIVAVRPKTDQATIVLGSLLVGSDQVSGGGGFFTVLTPGIGVYLGGAAGLPSPTQGGSFVAIALGYVFHDKKTELFGFAKGFES
jgi:hypothetical protein